MFSHFIDEETKKHNLNAFQSQWYMLLILMSPLVGPSLVMPLICKEMVELLDVGGANSSSANHSSLSNFAFLYGVFPTAPSVALYAAQFNMELEVVSGRRSPLTFSLGSTLCCRAGPCGSVLISPHGKPHWGRNPSNSAIIRQEVLFYFCNVSLKCRFTVHSSWNDICGLKITSG